MAITKVSEVGYSELFAAIYSLAEAFETNYPITKGSEVS